MIYLLTGDIGGTNSRMALYSAASTECHLDKPLYEKTYRNSEQIPSHLYDDPDVFPQYIIMPFLKYCWEENNNSSKKLATPTLHPLSQSSIVATLATAGMVNENRANLTNLGGMLIDGTAVAANGTCEFLKHIVVCRIINDFVAVRA